jgi:hypothetical protein
LVCLGSRARCQRGCTATVSPACSPSEGGSARLRAQHAQEAEAPARPPAPSNPPHAAHPSLPAARRLEDLQAPQLAQMLWSLAALDCRPAADWMVAFVEQVRGMAWLVLQSMKGVAQGGRCWRLRCSSPSRCVRCEPSPSLGPASGRRVAAAAACCHGASVACLAPRATRPPDAPACPPTRRPSARCPV